MAGTGAIFRIDSDGETEASARGYITPQIIEFNGGSVPDSTGRIIATGFRMIRDVSPHPNPKRALTLWQDNLLGTFEITVTGYFVDHDATAGPIQLLNWQTEAATNSSLEFGRFGLRLDHFAGGALDLTPSSTIGYILVDIDVNDVESPRDEVGFIARFVRNGAI